MPRIDPIDPAQAQGKAKALLDGVQKALGMTPNLMRTMARSPAVLEAYLGFGKALGGGSLSAQIREQIAVAVSGANSCEYCVSAHTAKNLGVAGTQNRIIESAAFFSCHRTGCTGSWPWGRTDCTDLRPWASCH